MTEKLIDRKPRCVGRHARRRPYATCPTIPMDYDGAMGVPITFLDKHNPEQFELLNADDPQADSTVPVKLHGLIKDEDSAVDGKPTYARIVIRRKDVDV